jgi:hypothetical protein
MNMVEAAASPGPHGPQVAPGTYTLKLTVDGKVYTQTVVVHNDPRVGESAATLNALKSQHALTMLAYKAMKDSYAANEDVAAARAQVASMMQAGSSGDAKAKELDAKLAAFGGAVEGRGGRGGFGGGRGAAAAPGAMQSFIALNNSFNTMISMMQVGMDMPPTPAQIETWESDCKNYNTTLAAWKKAAAEDLAAVKVNVAPTKLAPMACTFAAPSTVAKR